MAAAAWISCCAAADDDVASGSAVCGCWVLRLLKEKEAEAVIAMWEQRVKDAKEQNEERLVDLESAQYANFVVDEFAARKLPEVRTSRGGCPLSMYLSR